MKGGLVLPVCVCVCNWQGVLWGGGGGVRVTGRVTVVAGEGV